MQKTSPEDVENSTFNVMKVFSRSHSGSPREVRVKAWKVTDGSAEAPQLTLSDVDIPMESTETQNGYSREQVASDGQRGVPFMIASGRAGIHVY